MYKIVGISKYGNKILDEADTEENAMYLVSEYQIVFGIEWNIIYYELNYEDQH